AVANRENVVISFDPFDPAHPALTRALPLYLLMLMLLIGGVFVGGIAAWLRQGKWRRAARLAVVQARGLRVEMGQLPCRLGSATPGAPALPAQPAPRLTIPPPAA